MSCSVCRRDIRIVAKGLCNACYQRRRSRGTTDYAPKRERGICSIKDCGRPHVARGLCDLHHQRLLNTGDPEGVKRPDDWGAKHKHQLYNRWAYLQRFKVLQPISPEWDDFLQFVTDVGEPPNAASKLYAADDAKPIGPDNFVWKLSLTQKVEGEDEKTYARRSQRAQRHLDPERYAGYDLKKNYGLSLAEKAAMLAGQGHKCAICGCEEKLSIRGKRVGLAVDHCHGSGKVRGLLCYQCNTGLGSFKDDPALLDAAKAYLARNYFAPAETQE